MRWGLELEEEEEEEEEEEGEEDSRVGGTAVQQKNSKGTHSLANRGTHYLASTNKGVQANKTVT